MPGEGLRRFTYELNAMLYDRETIGCKVVDLLKLK